MNVLLGIKKDVYIVYKMPPSAGEVEAFEAETEDGPVLDPMCLFFDVPHLPTALQPMLHTQPDIQPLSYWRPRHSSNLYPLTQCVVCSFQYSKPLFVGSRGPRNPIHSTQCVHSLNHMVWYTVVSLCAALANTLPLSIPKLEATSLN